MKNLATILFALLAVSLFGQATKIDATKLLKPNGTNSTIMWTNGSGAVAWSNLAAIATAGTGISLSGNTITNSSPDQTVAFTNTAGITVTGTYPNFTITATDASATNELQTIAVSGTTSPVVTLSNSGGTFTLAAAGGAAWSVSGSTITLTQGATSLPTVDYQIYSTVLATNGTTVTVSGFTPTVAKSDVYVDGVLMENGSGNDYTLSGSTYTFTQTLNAGQKVLVKNVRVQ